jgi:hypothetical protein
MDRKRGLRVDFTSGDSSNQSSGAGGARRGTPDTEEAYLDGEEADPAKEHHPHHLTNRRVLKNMVTSTEYQRSSERRVVEAKPQRMNGDEAARPGDPTDEHHSPLPPVSQRGWKQGADTEHRKETKRSFPPSRMSPPRPPTT